jgi:hypothetical protein
MLNGHTRNETYTLRTYVWNGPPTSISSTDSQQGILTIIRTIFVFKYATFVNSIRPNKNVCLFQVTRPTLNIPIDPKYFFLLEEK